MTRNTRRPPGSGPPAPPWIALADGGQTVWVNLDHVRQILFCENEPDGPSALLWTGDDLWEIGDADALAALRHWVRARAFPLGGVNNRV